MIVVCFAQREKNRDPAEMPANARYAVDAEEREDVRRTTMVDVPSSHHVAVDPYATYPIAHPKMLCFVDDAVEQRYYDFQYIESSFITGKLLTVIIIFVFIFAYFAFPRGGPIVVPSSYMFGDAWWYLWHVMTVIEIALLAAMFAPPLEKYRELLFLATAGGFFPAWIVMVLVIKDPHVYLYTYITAPNFAFMMVQCRISRFLPIAVVLPLVTLFLVTFAFKADYWESHTYVEIAYWPVVSTVVLLMVDFERNTRRAFAEREKAQATVVAVEHKRVVTERMIAKFFPATPTKDLLRVGANGPRSVAYTGVAMIVTDIAGFTSYTSRTEPSAVIAMLTDLFHSIDLAADTYGIEKVCTVGDSYCGALFPSAAQSVCHRCTDAITFSSEIMSFAMGLEMRIGVHVGDVVGGFIGCSPPKFDLFGDGINHTRQMEESGRPSMVHVSSATITAIGEHGKPRGATSSDLGVLCSGWYVLDDNDDDCKPLTLREPDNEEADYISEVVAAIVALTSRIIDATESASDHDSNDDPMVQQDDAAERWGLHLILLQFNSHRLERQFARFIRASDINNGAARIFASLASAIIAIHMLIGCFESMQDRAAAAAVAALVLVMHVSLLWNGTKHRLHGVLTFVLYNAAFVIAITSFTGSCGGVQRREMYVGMTASQLFMIACFATQFVLNVKLKFRVLQLVTSSVLLLICTVIRRTFVGDEVAAFDAACFLAPACFFGVSYFSEFTLRTSFVATMRLQVVLGEARGRNARMAETALDVMLPAFVTERIVEAASAQRNKERGSSSAASDKASTTSSVAISEGNGAVEIDFNEVNVTWEFPHVVVLFATLRAEGLMHAAVDGAVQDMEDVAKRHGVLKVKTMGTTMMCVAGVNDGVSRMDATMSMIDAARDIRRGVLEPLSKEANGLHYAIGISCGPCFGAVIGGNGAIFDVFGDTVNTASRMMSTAASGVIQISTAAHASMPSDPQRLRCGVVALPPVQVKGKGVLDVFAIVEPHRDSTGVKLLE
jgi:class 3 adenylate cyclase